MTTKEKLDKCIEFIKSIENLYVPRYIIDELVDDYDGNNTNDKFVREDEIDKIKDSAWHLLADITD